MTNCSKEHHTGHAHKHGKNCGHPGVSHNGYVDYLHDGHLHHEHEGHIDEHALDVSGATPVRCTPDTQCDHEHGPNCEHDTIPHGDHFDYIVHGRMHHPHDGHCDDHGPVHLV